MFDLELYRLALQTQLLQRPATLSTPPPPSIVRPIASKPLPPPPPLMPFLSPWHFYLGHHAAALPLTTSWSSSSSSTPLFAPDLQQQRPTSRETNKDLNDSLGLEKTTPEVDNDKAEEPAVEDDEDKTAEAAGTSGISGSKQNFKCSEI